MINLPEGIVLSEEQPKLLLEKFGEARRETGYLYPWEGLEEKVRRMERSTLPFVGYGSLLNSSSAALTLNKETLQHRRPIIVFWSHRIFNYDMGEVVGRYGKPKRKLESAALNVRLTESLNDTMNAVLVEIPLIDIKALRKREIGYDLKAVVCLDWNELGEQPFIAYLLLCSDEPRLGHKRTDNTLLPHRKYYQVCREGAKEFGEPFLQYWLSTTYLADGVTSVANWESTAWE
ncbi:MAG: hypothetical protein KAT34_00375 [Candidatus Aminicenantes bacterium]|nr:hypothetical protein [Candidatus Aminicenantes bacterium]